MKRSWNGSKVTKKKRSCEASKRSVEEYRSENPEHWSKALLQEMEDPGAIVKKTNRLVVIRDKYPKAKIHYLVLPYEDIASVNELNESHIDLLNDFGKLFEEIKEEHKDVKLNATFHAIPSMYRLHMHIISNDMISPSLKHERHWNSFTTKYSLLYTDVLAELKNNGRIKKMSTEEYRNCMATPLICNQCSFKPNNMSNLKEHLLTHEQRFKTCLISSSGDHVLNMAQETLNFNQGPIFLHKAGNGGIMEMLDDLETKLHGYTGDDYCIILIGEADFRTTKNYCQLVADIKEKLTKIRHTNVILCSPPYKQCAQLYNSRVEVFIRHLYSDISTHKYAELFDYNMYSNAMISRQTGNLRNKDRIFNDLSKLIYSIASFNDLSKLVHYIHCASQSGTG